MGTLGTMWCVHLSCSTVAKRCLFSIDLVFMAGGGVVVPGKMSLNLYYVPMPGVLPVSKFW